MVQHSEFCSVVSLKLIVPEGQDPTTNQRTAQVPLKLPLNPGDGRTFPWLSGIATRFEKYRFKRIKVTYLPTTSTFTNGGIALCPIYDPADPPPDNRITLLNAEGVVRGAVHNQLTLNIPRSRMRNSDTMFVRETHEALMDPNELRMSDLGYVIVSLSDVSSTEALGDIFIEYDVELESPRVGPRIGKCAHIRREGFITEGSSPTAHSAPFGLNHIPSDRAYHSPGDTLMISLDDQPNKYTHTATGNDVDTSKIVFHEPFTGLMMYNHQTDGTAFAGGRTGIEVNGYKDSSNQAQFTPKAGATLDEEPWAITELLRGVASSVGFAHQIWKVVAQAGDVLELTHATAAEDTFSWVESMFADMSPELLALL